MHYEVIGDQTHIYAEDCEGEIEVLRAIVKSSYDSAPSNPHWMLTITDHLSDGEVNSFIRPSPRIYDDLIVEMHNVHGRSCNTLVYKGAERGHFIICNKQFRTQREDLQPMLERAKAYVGVTAEPSMA